MSKKTTDTADKANKPPAARGEGKKDRRTEPSKKQDEDADGGDAPLDLIGGAGGEPSKKHDADAPLEDARAKNPTPASVIIGQAKAGAEAPRPPSAAERIAARCATNIGKWRADLENIESNLGGARDEAERARKEFEARPDPAADHKAVQQRIADARSARDREMRKWDEIIKSLADQEQRERTRTRQARAAHHEAQRQAGIAEQHARDLEAKRDHLLDRIASEERRLAELGAAASA